ncbi:MAG TPA: hypothetical protein VMF55_13890 [Solirubrobacterales bacterium]|nr:hypothetical protein [Solirubrobacterales bacterium]
MFYCERCGTSFNAAAMQGAMACPRCRLKEGVYSPLTFSIVGSIAIGEASLASRELSRPVGRSRRFAARPDGGQAPTARPE